MRCFLTVSALFIALPALGDGVASGELSAQKDLRAKLINRVDERWSYLKEKSYDRSYEFYSPARRRQVTLGRYTSSMGGSVDWVSVDISSVDLESKRAVVMVDVSYKLALPGPEGLELNDSLGILSKNLKEVWVWRGNEWWFVNPIDSKL